MSRLINPFEQILDGSGDPVALGLLDFFVSGSSSVRKTTFADSAQTIANSNPVVLGGDGVCPNVFGPGSYNVILRTSAGEQLRARDPVGGDGGLAFGENWAAVVEYSQADQVRDDGTYWQSLISANIGNQPSLDSGGKWVKTDFTKIIVNTAAIAANAASIIANATTSANAAAANLVKINNIADYNYIINGTYDHWNYATSQTSSGYGSDDRWNNINSGSTKVASQQAFALGQTEVSNNPEYFSRTVVSSNAGADNFVIKQQRVEFVRSLSGKTATISFFAKADANKNIAVEFVQDFGSGGSPSSVVQSIGVTTFNLTTSLQKFTASVSIPSISGKSIGSNRNDFLEVNFWLDAGSNRNSRTNSLGQQSGTFDIAEVSLIDSAVDRPALKRSFGDELSLCQRFYQEYAGGSGGILGVTASNVRAHYSYYFNTEFRAAPSIIAEDQAGNAGKYTSVNGNNRTFQAGGLSATSKFCNLSAIGQSGDGSGFVSMNAKFSAEL